MRFAKNLFKYTEKEKSLAAAASFFDMSAIVGTTNNFDFEAWNVLGSTASNEHDVMLLKVMTLSRYISCHFFAVTQTHKNAFTVTRVGFLRFLDDGLENDAFHLRLVVQDRLFVGLDPLLSYDERRSHVRLPQSHRPENGLADQAGQVAVLQEVTNGRSSYAFTLHRESSRPKSSSPTTSRVSMVYLLLIGPANVLVKELARPAKMPNIFGLKSKTVTKSFHSSLLIPPSM